MNGRVENRAQLLDLPIFQFIQDSDLPGSPDEIVNLLYNAQRAYHPPTARHCSRVADYATNIAITLGLSKEKVSEIETGGKVHDIGKIGIPLVILDKPASLSDSEYEKMKLHTVFGADIIEFFPELKHLQPLIKYHHERMDGFGYPDGLQGEEIPIGARILAVADTYDTMTANRIYRRTTRMREALKELQRCSPAQYDGEVVEAFATIFDQIPPYNSYAETTAASYLQEAMHTLINVIPQIVAAILYSNAVKPSHEWPRDIDLVIITDDAIPEKQLIAGFSFDKDWVFDEHSIPPVVPDSYRLVFQKPLRPEVDVWLWPLNEIQAALRTNENGYNRPIHLHGDRVTTANEIARLISQGVVIYLSDNSGLQNTSLASMPMDNIMGI